MAQLLSQTVRRRTLPALLLLSTTSSQARPWGNSLLPAPLLSCSTFPSTCRGPLGLEALAS